MSPDINDEIEWDALPGLFPAFESPGRWLPLLQRHLALVEEAAPQTRVTSVPASEAVRRHYAECLELLRVASRPGPPASVVDVGSGGGYPGLVIAAVMPGAPVTLIEPLKKRARLLEAMAAELGLVNVRVDALRAEEAGRGAARDSGDLVTARAVAPLAELLEYTAPLARVGGAVVLAKGSGLADELGRSARAQDELRCALETIEKARPAISPNLAFALFRKLDPTPAKYPRRPGFPGKRPLQNG
ncbi:MAG: 16S rRNA (guanine(527)-N(7))-methyltransferase RsmG [Dehalococcoidia bacterium]